MAKMLTFQCAASLWDVHAMRRQLISFFFLILILYDRPEPPKTLNPNPLSGPTG